MPSAWPPQPKDCRDLLNVVWDNRKQLRYAWSILTHGVCDGCALGPEGLRDHVLEGVHLCMNRLKLLKLNTLPALDLAVATSVARLRPLTAEQLRALGRLAYPMVRRKGEPGFLRVSWKEALDVVCRSVHDIAPHQMGFCATPRSLTNESYYVLQKLARVLGTNNVDLCSQGFDGACLAALKSTLGYGAPTCSLSDFIGTDLLVLFGPDIVDHQPVTAQYIDFAKKAGTNVVTINPPSNDRWEQHATKSASHNTRLEAELTHSLFQTKAGGCVAFINGVVKALIANNRLDSSFITKRTARFGELKHALENQSWEMLERTSGAARTEMQRLASLYGAARTAVIVYSASVSQPERGVDNVTAIVNLALARGMLGRQKCGIMALRSHSGAPGGSDCGAAPDNFPGGFSVDNPGARRFSNLWHHPVPSTPGLRLPEMIAAAGRDEIRFLYSMGGNLLDESMLGSSFVAETLSRVPVRVHQDTLLNTSMLLDAEQAVVLLPGQTRYEQRSGGTSTSIERRIRFTPEIPGHRLGETLPEWEIPELIGRKAMPNGDKLFPFDDTQAIREEISRVMPIYRGVEKLTREGDQLQWGGPQLYTQGFTMMPANRALFTALEPPECRGKKSTGGKNR